jgi:rfaE bifunctional protein nucleotidyltransferase chain/domain
MLNQAISLFSVQEVKKWRNSISERGVIWTNGCFDLFHLGHALFLNDVRAVDPEAALIVGVDSDRSVSKLKGPKRPILPQTHRMSLVAMHRMVDAVVLFETERLEEFVAAAWPTYLVKDETYKDKSVVGAGLAKKGVIYAKFNNSYGLSSTTAIINRITSLYNPARAPDFD